MKQLDFKHRFIPSPLQQNIASRFNQKQRSKDNKPESLTLLLLHGTGGSEDDLIPIGQMLSSSASLLSPRGKILENGMHRFFKRLSEGVFDIEDLKFRTKELANFVKVASNVYSFDLNKTIAVGFSNGANIAASLLLSNPETIKDATYLEQWFLLYRRAHLIYLAKKFFYLLERLIHSYQKAKQKIC